jgi:glycosyltransferase involved in cell wall biosynthesis
MGKRKLTYIVSDIDKSLHFEWITPHLKETYQLTFVLINKKPGCLENFLKAQNVSFVSLQHSSKLDLIRVWFKVFFLLLKLRPHIIHTHLWIANIIGLTAAFATGVDRRVYTRHHATIHYYEFPSGLKWDRLCNWIATDIIAISKNIRRILLDMDRAKRSKVKLIHHGFDMFYFKNVDEERVKLLRSKFSLNTTNKPVIGVISRFIESKGIQYIIPAFKKLLIQYPAAHLLLANASGNYEHQIKDLLNQLPESSYRCVKFENDLSALYRLMDIFIHVPVDVTTEAFGQIYVEPLIVGIPSIFTLSGVAAEFIEHRKNALVVDFKQADPIYDSMILLLQDESLRKEIIQHGKQSVTHFDIANYLKKLDVVYAA